MEYLIIAAFSFIAGQTFQACFGHNHNTKGNE